MLLVAAAILKSRLNSAGMRKLSGTVFAVSGLDRFFRVSAGAGGSPFLLVFGGGGVLIAIVFSLFYVDKIYNALANFFSFSF